MVDLMNDSHALFRVQLNYKSKSTIEQKMKNKKKRLPGDFRITHVPFNHLFCHL